MSNRRTKKYMTIFQITDRQSREGWEYAARGLLARTPAPMPNLQKSMRSGWPLTSEQDCVTHSLGLFLTLSLLNVCNIRIKVYTTFENVGNTGLRIPDNLTPSASSTVKCIATGGHWQSLPVNLALSVAKLPNTCYFNTMSVSKVLQVWLQCVSWNLEKGYEKVWSHIIFPLDVWCLQRLPC